MERNISRDAKLSHQHIIHTAIDNGGDGATEVQSMSDDEMWVEFLVDDPQEYVLDCIIQKQSIGCITTDGSLEPGDFVRDFIPSVATGVPLDHLETVKTPVVYVERWTGDGSSSISTLPTDSWHASVTILDECEVQSIYDYQWDIVARLGAVIVIGDIEPGFACDVGAFFARLQDLAEQGATIIGTSYMLSDRIAQYLDYVVHAQRSVQGASAVVTLEIDSATYADNYFVSYEGAFYE